MGSLTYTVTADIGGGNPCPIDAGKMLHFPLARSGSTYTSSGDLDGITVALALAPVGGTIGKYAANIALTGFITDTCATTVFVNVSGRGAPSLCSMRLCLTCHCLLQPSCLPA